ncbi:MAG: RNA polymerase sigma factor [Verrucomicrobiota bacterium]|nr:RNA polymerase sigma factor [Verrucomicrobiota bacterium]
MNSTGDLDGNDPARATGGLPEAPGDSAAPGGEEDPGSRSRDAELADGLKRRDPVAIREVMTLYGDRLLRSAYLMCGRSEADAQDLAQDTFVQAVRSAGSFLGRSSLYSWLHGILINVSRNFRRKQSRLIYAADLPEPAIESAGRDSGSDTDATPAALMQALRGLSDEHRDAVILYYFNGMNVPEIAEQTGVSLGTAKSRLHYAVKHLRRALQKK